MRNNSEIFLRMKDFNIYNSRIDMHMHTVWTDGKDTIIDMVKQADINRLTSIAITDHIRKKSDYYPIYLIILHLFYIYQLHSKRKLIHDIYLFQIV